MVSASFEEITKSVPKKSLLLPLKKRAGRNNRGVVNVRHRGGGAKRRLRIIDFKRDKPGIQGKVAAIEYDPNRSARIALIHYVDGEKRYILAPSGLKVGDVIMTGESAEIKPGNALPLGLIPDGTLIHNLEFEPGKGGQIVRSAIEQVLQERPGIGSAPMFPCATDPVQPIKKEDATRWLRKGERLALRGPGTG